MWEYPGSENPALMNDIGEKVLIPRFLKTYSCSVRGTIGHTFESMLRLVLCRKDLIYRVRYFMFILMSSEVSL